MRKISLEHYKPNLHANSVIRVGSVVLENSALYFSGRLMTNQLLIMGVCGLVANAF